MAMPAGPASPISASEPPGPRWAAPAPEPPGAWRAFLHGLLRPSPLAIGLAILLNVVTFAVLTVVLTPGFLATHNAGILADGPTDYDAFVTAHTLALQRSETSEPLLVLLGGSTVRASLLESDITEGLRNGGHGDVRLVKLCTSRQSLWETLALAEYLPSGARGVVVIGTGPTLFSLDEQELKDLASHPRLGLRSATLDEEFHRRGLPVGARSGIYFFDNAAYLLPRLHVLLGSWARGRPTRYVDSRYVGMAPARPAVWQSVARRVDARMERIDANQEASQRVLVRVLATIRERTDLRVILVESPVNPRFLTEFGRHGLVARHRQRMREFAREQGVDYLVLGEAVQLPPGDFFDWAHLRDRDAIRRCADAVLRSVRALLASPGRARAADPQH